MIMGTFMACFWRPVSSGYLRSRYVCRYLFVSIYVYVCVILNTNQGAGKQKPQILDTATLWIILRKLLDQSRGFRYTNY